MSSVGKIRRMLQLLEQLQSGRTLSSAQLAEQCGVSRRTVFRDLKMLQESGVELLYDAQRQGYWIPGHAFLPPTNLTLAETLSLLVLTREATSGDRAIPFQEVARDASMKLQSNLPHHLTSYAGEMSEAFTIQAEPQATNQLGGREHYERMVEAAIQKRKVRIRYDSLAEKSQIQTLLSPYRLLFRRHAWYVIGRSSVHRAVRTFHVGRILSSESTEEEFTVPPRFSLKRYFGQAWNLVREPNAREQVTIRFQPLVARNVAEVAWHATQKVIWNPDGTMDFTVTVDGIHEISWWILSYGDQALVLEPQSLRELVADRAKKMAAQYEHKSTKRRSRKKKS